MKYKKFYLKCNQCEHAFDFTIEIFNSHSCPSCSNKYLDVNYEDELINLPKVVFGESNHRGMWKYFDYLPLNTRPESVRYENDISIQRIIHLEDIAKKKYNIHCKVFGHRFDESISTGTWKDLSGAMMGSALSENNINNYVAASTGNIGVAMASYLTFNKLNLYVFIPESSSTTQESEIASFGQKVIRVKGDYTAAKSMAKAFAAQNNFVYSNGTFDIFRLEAKKTMTFDWARKLDTFPTVYIQALSGGTGPLGVYKGCKELIKRGLIEKQPRQILIQTDKCAPMANAWKNAQKTHFLGDWNKSYEEVINPQTSIATLSTGNPYAYPEISQIIKRIDGHITSMDEKLAIDIARLMALKTSIRIGPAAAIGMGGFFKALSENKIRNSDSVMINIGEGMRRSPQFLNNLLQKSICVEDIKELEKYNLAEAKLTHDEHTDLIDKITTYI